MAQLATGLPRNDFMTPRDAISQCSPRKLCALELCSAQPVQQYIALLSSKQEESRGNPSRTPFGLLSHLSKATDCETTSPFPLQSNKAAMVTAPKYIRNASWVL